MNVTIHGPNLNDQSKGSFHVHAANCRDNRWEITKNSSVGPTDFDASSVLDVVEMIYSDILAENPDETVASYVSDFHFCPCTKDLPYETNPQETNTMSTTENTTPETATAAVESKPKATRKPAAKKTPAKPAAKPAKAKAAPKSSEPKPAAKRVRATAEDLPKSLATKAVKQLVKEKADQLRWGRKSRSTGTTIGIFDNRDGKFYPESDHKWFTACIDHGTLVPAPNVNVATDYLAHVAIWCPEAATAAPAPAAK
jgi:pyruvate/2-oxoglutarate dehydrogenase complex dihydrolipoamide acyltransferase (E2) component